MKTIEEIYAEMYEAMPFHIHSMVKPYILEAMQAYADQQVSIAVENTLIKCSAKAVLHSSQLAEEILHLAPQILEELKGGEGEKV